MSLTLRVRYPAGQGVLKDINPTDTIQKLITQSFDVLGIENSNSDHLKILSGFPPKPLDISDRQISIGSTEIKSGDTLIYQFDKPGIGTGDTVVQPTKEKEPQSNGMVFGGSASAVGGTKHSGPTPDEGRKRLKADSDVELKRQVVPADNSCLFTSINFCMSGEVVKSEHSVFMREIIATTVAGDPEKYSEPFLGQTNERYCAWIQGKDAWGGGIELQILAEYFQVQIVVVDTKSGCLTKFGETGNFSQMMILIYDGIHYDALYLPSSQSKRSVFNTSENSILESALKLAEKEKLAHNYTDTAGFTLKCLVCGHRMMGEKEAQSHAQSTKHTNFSEI
ncbi:ubiquitin thioesterase OTU1 [Eurytemora carolleeae]|uniref:ubiquitin thioesterase OTU1 n=1 Tax=Eurytemora carolleeae TaxID=1294199 RepID=UPI000C782BBC|nr:ubiquitin thioesterase OTU1 [Eurytemora carolleeae]|eukprot:XP_023346813.1 ubiquitin thioesterase OTU1-like [Eurytemora affinis]